MLCCANLLCFRISKSTVYLLFQTALHSHPGHFQISCGSQRVGTVIRRHRQFDIDCTRRPHSNWIWRWWSKQQNEFFRTVSMKDPHYWYHPWCKVVLDMLLHPFLVKNFPSFKRSEYSLPCPWETATGLYPETDNQVYTIAASRPRLHLGLHSVLHFVVTKVFSEMNCVRGSRDLMPLLDSAHRIFPWSADSNENNLSLRAPFVFSNSWSWRRLGSQFISLTAANI